MHLDDIPLLIDHAIFLAGCHPHVVNCVVGSFAVGLGSRQVVAHVSVWKLPSIPGARPSSTLWQWFSWCLFPDGSHCCVHAYMCCMSDS